MTTNGRIWGEIYLAAAAIFLSVSPGIGMLVTILLGRSRDVGGGGPVAIGVPPASLIFLFFFVASTPWIIAAILSICNRAWAGWIHLILTVPTFIFGLYIGWNILPSRSLEVRLIMRSTFLASLGYCLVVWLIIALRKNVLPVETLRRSQFSLRSALLIVTTICVYLGMLIGPELSR